MCFKKKTSQGVKIDRRKIAGLPSDNNHEQAISVIIDGCSKHFDKQKVEETIKNITIEWWSDIAPSPSTGILNTVVTDSGSIYSGLTVGNTCKVAWRGKIFRSAFVHEILHVVGRNILNDEDPYHKNSDLWKIEQEINTTLITIDL